MLFRLLEPDMGLPPGQRPPHLAGLDLLCGVFQHIAGHVLQIQVQGVAGGHEVVVVDGLDEGLRGKDGAQCGTTRGRLGVLMPRRLARRSARANLGGSLGCCTRLPIPHAGGSTAAPTPAQTHMLFPAHLDGRLLLLLLLVLPLGHLHGSAREHAGRWACKVCWHRQTFAKETRRETADLLACIFICTRMRNPSLLDRPQDTC